MKKTLSFVDTFKEEYVNKIKTTGGTLVQHWKDHIVDEYFGTTTMVHTFGGAQVLTSIRANKSTGITIGPEYSDTLYLILFESLRESWEKNWESFGRIMVDNMIFDPSV